jgi:DNA repair exonuclease SbcCD ATPase subunit
MPDNIQEPTQEQTVSTEASQDVSARVQELERKASEATEALRKVQSTKDAEVAAANRRAQEQAAQVEQLRQQMLELVHDPAARADLQMKQMQAELEHFRQVEKARQDTEMARQAYSEQFGVPLEHLAAAKDPHEAFQMAGNYVKSKISASSTPPAQEEPPVVVATSTAPQTRPEVEYDARVKELREEVKATGKSKSLDYVKASKVQRGGTRPRV